MSKAATPPATRPRRTPRRMLIMLGLVCLYFLVLLYPYVRLGQILWPNFTPQTWHWLVLLVGPAAGWLLHQRWRNPVTRTLLRVAYTWIGAAFLSLVLIGTWDLFTVLVSPWRSFASSTAVTLVVGVVCYAFFNAHRISTRQEIVRTTKLSEPVRIVQLSDVHIGSRTTSFFRRALARTRRLRPDYVVITGDLVDLLALPDSIYEPLRDLDAPVLFAIGNHERYIGADAVCDRLRAVGVTVLRNERWSVEADGPPIDVIGIDDAEARDQVATELPAIATDPSRFSILMYHRPDGFEDAAAAGIDLMLCGHTHNGQIMPFNYVVRRVFDRIRGRYERDGAVLYVSPGTGTWGPIMRLGSANEVTVIDLVPDPTSEPVPDPLSDGATPTGQPTASPND